jgi:methyl-accepting chemotaxis protein
MLKNMNVGTRMGSAFALLIALNLVAMAILAFDMSNSSRSFRVISNELIGAERLAHEWAAITEENGTRTVAVLTSNNAELVSVLSSEIDENSKRVNAIQDSIAKLLLPADRDGFFARVKEKRGAYSATRKSLLEAKRLSGTAVSLRQVKTELSPTLDAYRDELLLFATELRTRVDEANARLERSNAHGIEFLAGLAVLQIAVSMLVAWAITRSITRPLSLAVQAARAVAEGNLADKIPADVGGGELGQLMTAILQMRDSLKQLIGQTLDNTSHLNAAAGELSQMTNEIASRARSQSEESMGMAASVEELTVSTSLVSDNASATLEATTKARETADKGAHVITQTVAAMNALANTVHSSSVSIEAVGVDSVKIETVLQVIREIADQTNLLALNAAIEAARAGETGRGFAVVADEVRKLAERTGTSTTEIKATIDKMRANTQDAMAKMNASVEQANQGVALAQLADSAISDINTNFHSIVERINDMSLALREQSHTSHALAGNVERIAQSAEQSASITGSLAARSGGLADMASKLDRSLERFSL